MRRLIVSLILLFSCLRAYPQEVKPYLRIETGSHTAFANRIDLDAAEQFLVSASDDKTARVWDLHSGKLLQILRPPIGDGDEGKLYAVAIAPDGKTVAVGGFTGTTSTSIYIFDRASGAIRKVIPGLPDATNHLAYSRDGRYLAAALSGNHGIRIYETQTYTEVGRDTDYADISESVEFDKVGKLVSTSYDGYVRLYNPDFHFVTKQKPPGGNQPTSARFSPDGNFVAVGFDDSARVDVLLAKGLSYQYSAHAPSSGFGLESASWTADGRTLCAAGKYNKGNVHPVLCWGNAGKGTLSSFPIGDHTVMDIRGLRDGGNAFALAEGTVGLLAPGGAVKWRAAPEILDYRGLRGMNYPQASSDGNTVEAKDYYFNGTDWTNHNIRFSVQERILEIGPQADTSLSSPVAQGLDVKDWEDTTSPTLGGKPLNLKQYERSRSLAIAPKQDSFILGADWDIYRFDRQGTQIWQTSVPGTAWGVNISHDGRFVVATLGDGTIRWYTFDTGKEVLALFVDRDLKRWVAWNPDGFFTFDGPNADSLIGYQINRGPDHAGDFVKVDQLREVFYRPDLIAQILQPGGADKVLSARNRVGDIAQLLSGGSTATAQPNLPPEIELISSDRPEMADEYTLQFRIKDMGGGYSRIVYRIDGVEIGGRRIGMKGSGNDKAVRDVVEATQPIKDPIPVESGAHKLEVSGYTADGKIEGPRRTIPLTGPPAGRKPNLYLVAAGVSHYSDPSLNDGVRFGAADAELVAAKFQEQKGQGLYPNVHAVSLPESKATIKNIEYEVAQAAKAAGPGDTFILYLAGHGIAVDGDYYFIPWEANPTSQKDLLASSLNRAAIQALLSQVHTRKSVLILDTCGAGAVLGSEGLDSEEKAIEKVAMLSGHVVLAASNQEKIALEGLEDHGVFTYFLVEGIKAADSDEQGEILVAQLGVYTQKKVPDFTEKRWHYRQVPVVHAPESFPIAHKVAK